MAIKKVAFEFNPFSKTGITVPKNKLKEAKQAVADFVKEQVLSSVGDGKSPVKNGNWKRTLSKEYKAHKSDVSSANFSNLELSGSMLDDLDVVSKSGEKLSLQITGINAEKADGNNRGSYGKGRGDSSKAREFIPKTGQTFKDSIWSGIKDILKDFEDGEENK